MKVFFGFIVLCLIVGAALWHHPAGLKNGILFALVAFVCAVYYFFNQI